MRGVGRRGDGDGRRQEASGDLREFLGNKRHDVSVPTMKDLGLDLREHWANLGQPPNAKMRLGVLLPVMG